MKSVKKHSYLFSLGNLTFYYGTMISHQDSYIPGLIKFYEKLYHHNMLSVLTQNLGSHFSLHIFHLSACWSVWLKWKFN